MTNDTILSLSVKSRSDRVKAHFGDYVKGDVERYELPNLGALNFLLYGALGGGGTFRFGLTRRAKHTAQRYCGWRSRSMNANLEISREARDPATDAEPARQAKRP